MLRALNYFSWYMYVRLVRSEGEKVNDKINKVVFSGLRLRITLAKVARSSSRKLDRYDASDAWFTKKRANHCSRPSKTYGYQGELR